MSDKHTSSDELDLGQVFGLIQNGFYNLIREVFKAIAFGIRYWWVIVLLIAAGIVLGLQTKPDPEFKATLVVKANFDSHPIIYNAVDQVSSNLSNLEYLGRNGIQAADFAVSGVKISPVVNVTELLSKMENTNVRNFEAILRNLRFEDDVDLMETDQFYSNYDYHRLEVTLVERDKRDQVNTVIDLINSNEQLEQMSSRYRETQADRIAFLEGSIRQVDTILQQYIDNVTIATQSMEDMAFFNNQNNLNINSLITAKAEFNQEAEELKMEQVTSDKALVAVSNIELVEDVSLRDRHELLFPILFVLGFLGIAFARYLYVSLKRKVG
jgi:hypothetical protein